jgi:hypothetical protein
VLVGEHPISGWSVRIWDRTIYPPVPFLLDRRLEIRKPLLERLLFLREKRRRESQSDEEEAPDHHFEILRGT